MCSSESGDRGRPKKGGGEGGEKMWRWGSSAAAVHQWSPAMFLVVREGYHIECGA